MKGIIWYQENTEQAKEILKKMIEKYKLFNINIAPGRGHSRETKYEMHVEFDNGDVWDVFKARESCRGYKCNISYVSRSIPLDMVNVIIYPCTIAPPYHGINYWYEEPIVRPNANVSSVNQIKS